MFENRFQDNPSWFALFATKSRLFEMQDAQFDALDAKSLRLLWIQKFSSNFVLHLVEIKFKLLQALHLVSNTAHYSVYYQF